MRPRAGPRRPQFLLACGTTYRHRHPAHPGHVDHHSHSLLSPRIGRHS